MVSEIGPVRGRAIGIGGAGLCTRGITGMEAVPGKGDAPKSGRTGAGGRTIPPTRGGCDTGSTTGRVGGIGSYVCMSGTGVENFATRGGGSANGGGGGTGTDAGSEAGTGANIAGGVNINGGTTGSGPRETIGGTKTGGGIGGGSGGRGAAGATKTGTVFGLAGAAGAT